MIIKIRDFRAQISASVLCLQTHRQVSLQTHGSESNLDVNLGVSGSGVIFVSFIMLEKPSPRYRLTSFLKTPYTHTEKKSEMQVGIAGIFVFKANSMGEMIKQFGGI